MSKDLQDKIHALLTEQVNSGNERGAQVAVYHQGELIADTWAGVADVRTGKPVDGDTLFPVYSCTKGIVATVIHLLAERGQLDYDTPIAHYWPEFAANGKEGITVRHALTHGSGLQYMPVGIDHPELCNWDTMCRLMAQQKPAWPPNEKLAYHPVTFGWILGEVARRIDGRAFQPFVEDEIGRPLGITTMFSGIPEYRESEVAYLEEIFEEKPEPVEPPAPSNPAEQGVSPFMWPLADWMNRSDARQACIPASNGIMNARALARHYAALVPGGIDGVQLLPDSRMKLATEQMIPKCGYEPGVTLPFGLGYRRGEGGHAHSFGHGGYGGTLGYGDPDSRLAVAIIRNRFSSSNLVNPVVELIKSTLGVV